MAKRSNTTRTRKTDAAKKTDAVKTDAKKADAAKAESVQQEVKADTAKAESVQQETAKADAVKTDDTKIEQETAKSSGGARVNKVFFLPNVPDAFIETVNGESRIAKVHEDWTKMWNMKKYRPLTKADFKDRATFYDWKAAEMELKADEYRELAKGERTGAGVKERKLKKMAEQFDALKQQLVEEGVDVESILGTLIGEANAESNGEDSKEDSEDSKEDSPAGRPTRVRSLRFI